MSKKHNRESKRLDGWGVIVGHDGSRPSKHSKRLKPKRLRPARKDVLEN